MEAVIPSNVIEKKYFKDQAIIDKVLEEAR